MNAAIDPSAAGGRAIVLKVLEVVELLAVCHAPAVDLFQNLTGGRLVVFTFGGIVPCESTQSCIARSRAGPCLQATAEMVNEPEIAAIVAGWIDSFLAKLQQTLRIGEGACFFSGARGWKKKNFRADRVRREFSALDLR